MEDTKVTFETAKLAKEKRFPQETNRLEIPYYNYKGEFKGDVSDWRVRRYIRGEDTSDIEFVSAPTQSLLAKWLREEYNIIVLVDYEGIDGYYYKFYSYKEGNKNYDASYKNYNTYEEALEAGLYQALLLL